MPIGFDSSGDVFELGVTIRMVLAFTSLSIALQRIAEPFENPRNLRATNLVTLSVELNRFAWTESLGLVGFLVGAAVCF